MPRSMATASSSAGSFSRATLSPRRSATVDVVIDNHYKTKVYTSGSSISGQALITPTADTRFDRLEVVLVGMTKTRLEAVQIPQRASHVFLKLEMPIPDNVYPVPRLLEAGETYIVPFHFVIPHHLTMSACSHPASSPLIQEYHMRLPPSVGGWGRDDWSPETAGIEYAIKARVLRQPADASARHATRIFEGSLPICVLPVAFEEPPVRLSPEDKTYSPIKTKHVRKNKLLTTKLGKLTARAEQPAAVHLSTDGRTSTDTAATIHLAWTPSSSTPEAQPPRVTSVTAKLGITTYYSSAPMTKLPNLGSRSALGADQRLAYKTSTPVFDTPVGKVKWTEREPGPISRRDSGYSSDAASSEDESSEFAPHALGTAEEAAAEAASSWPPTPQAKNPDATHLAALYIPFSLPKSSRKIFLPTFHSCLVSRTYALTLTLTVGPANTHITVSVPLQIAMEGTIAAEESAADKLANADPPTFEAVMALQAEEAAADAHLRPRILGSPSSDIDPLDIGSGSGSGSSGVLPPGYEAVEERRNEIPILRGGFVAA